MPPSVHLDGFVHVVKQGLSVFFVRDKPVRGDMKGDALGVSVCFQGRPRVRVHRHVDDSCVTCCHILVDGFVETGVVFLHCGEAGQHGPYKRRHRFLCDQARWFAVGTASNKLATSLLHLCKREQIQRCCVAPYGV